AGEPDRVTRDVEGAVLLSLPLQEKADRLPVDEADPGRAVAGRGRRDPALEDGVDRADSPRGERRRFALLAAQAEGEGVALARRVEGRVREDPHAVDL